MAKWEQFFREKGWKNRKKSDWAAIALTGVLILILAVPVSDRKKEESSTAVTKSETDSTAGKNQTEVEAYTLYLERKLNYLLEQMDGVGKVKVMLTLADSGEHIVEKEEKSQSQEVTETDASGGSRTTKEIQKENTAVFVENGSDTYPYVNREVLPAVEGVVVVAQGGDNPTVVSDISDMVMALFKVEAHKIKVVKMDSGEEKQ